MKITNTRGWVAKMSIFTPSNLYFVWIMYKHALHKSVVGGSSMIGVPLVTTDFKQDMQGIKHGPLGWHTRSLTTELKEVRKKILQYVDCLKKPNTWQLVAYIDQILRITNVKPGNGNVHPNEISNIFCCFYVAIN